MATAGLPEIAAAVATKPVAAPPPVTIDQKNQWNGFLDYLKQKGLQGSPLLDNRDTGLGQQLMQQYKAQNPHFTLTYDQVPAIQQELQSYRQGLVQKYKANPSVVPDVKSEDQIMPGLSPVDGWLGSKTSSWKFPGATITNSVGTVRNFGLNTAAYDAAMAKMKGGK